MIGTSFEFRRAVARSSKVLAKATLTLADGTVRELTGDDLMMGSPAFSDAVSSMGSFDIGAAIINRVDLTLNNYDGRFDDIDFEGSTIVPYVGVRLSDGVEWLRKGVFAVERPTTLASVISTSGLDNMRKLECPYAEVATSFPASLRTIAQDICDHCGVILDSPDFANCGYVVAERPDDDQLTCIAMMAYVAQASGNWARCNRWGDIELNWYDTSCFEGEDWLDGDRFDGASPYASGDSASGGDFVDYGGGDDADGGGFPSRRWVHAFALASAQIGTDDVVVTGVRATVQGATGEEAESHLFGDEGYVLSIPDNPLVQAGEAQAVATQVGLRVVGMRFRPFDISAISDPSVEAGDPIVITDGRQRQYRSYITALTYKVGSYEALSCHAETPSRNRAASYSALTRAIVALRNADKAERSARELAMDHLAEQLAESSGLYKTEQVQQDGSVIYYAHDKATLAESQIVWKFNANALGVSSDGGKTYPFGLDAGGDAILSHIYAIGLNADYITSGALTVRDGSTTVFSADADTGVVVLQDASGNMWNLHTGQLRMAAGSTIGGRNVSAILDAVDATVTDVVVEFAQNQSQMTPPDESSQDWSTNNPSWREGWYIWQRMAITSGGQTSHSNVVCISGRDGASGTNAAAIYLYKRAANAPTRPSTTLTYTFSTGELAGDLAGWSRGIPDGDATCWVTIATAISNSGTDTIAPAEWSAPVQLAAGGVDGLNQATVYLHKRAPEWRLDGGTADAPEAQAMSVSGTTATLAGHVEGTTFVLDSCAPAAPSGTLAYNFATGVLSGDLEGWTRGVPDGDEPCWVTTAVAISSEAAVSVAPTSWAEVVKLVEDGHGLGIESVDYAVGSSDATPPTDGWQTTVPNVPDGSWLWTRTTYTDGSTSLSCAWQGIGVVADPDQYYLSTSDSEPVGGMWSMTQPEWAPGTYVWKRKAITWSNGTTSYTEPILARGVNDASESAHSANEAIVTLDQALDQEGVFNRLTNGGEAQGIYLEDSKLYINASYVMTGTLNANLIKTGAIVVTRGGQTVFSANIDTGVVSLSGDCVTIGSESATSAIKAARAIYGTCVTAAGTAAKVVSCDDFKLQAGAIVSVRFANANSTTNPTLNVNGTGAKAIRLNGQAIPEEAWWGAGQTMTFVYDGTSWTVSNGATIAQAVTNANDISTLVSTAEQFSLQMQGYSTELSQIRATYAVCATGAGTAAKNASCENFVLRPGAMVAVKFTYANSATNPTLNVNETGAKPIFLNGAAIPEASWWKAGDVVTLVYGGAQWLVADGSTLAALKVTSEGLANLSVRSDALEATVKGVQATYALCSTASGTQVKVATIANFKAYVGQTVTVRFTYANTADSPKLRVTDGDVEVAEGYVVVNNTVMQSDYYWGANGTLTLVWDGAHWRVGDGQTMSGIKMLRDSISLTVSNASLGSTASIKLSVGDREVSRNLNLTNVRQAFRDDSSAIAISAGRITFNSNTFVVNSTYFKVTNTGVITATSGSIGGFTITDSSIYNGLMTLDSDGLSLKRNSVMVGNIGTNNMVGYTSQRGLVFDLESSGSYMAWASRDSSSDSVYTIKMLYARSTTNGFVTNRLSVCCNLDLKGNIAYNFWIDPNTGGANGGIDGTLRFAHITRVNSDGSFNYLNGCYLQFKAGMLVNSYWASS